MILHRPLTPEERKVSQRYYNKFSFVNGASYMCLGESIILLLANSLKLPNEGAAILGAMVYLGYLLMPLGVLRTAKVGAAACQADFWVARNISALIIASSAFVYPYSQYLSWSFIILGSLMFYGCRAAGCVLSTPLVGDITVDDETPILINKNAGLFNISGGIMIILISLALFKFKNHGIWPLVVIIVTGAVIGIISSTITRKIQESGDVQKAAKQKFFSGLIEAFKNKDIRRLSVGWFALSFTTIMVYPISYYLIKRGLHYSDSMAMVCTALSLAGGYLFSTSSAKLCCAFGPKMLMKSMVFVYFIVAYIFINIPMISGSKSILVYIASFLAFALIGIGNICVNSSAATYFLMICPDKNKQVTASISLQLVVSVCAGILGSVFSTTLLKVARYIFETTNNGFTDELGIYKVYYICTIPFIAICFFLVNRMRKVVSEFRAKYGHDTLVRLVRHVNVYHRQINRIHIHSGMHFSHGKHQDHNS